MANEQLVTVATPLFGAAHTFDSLGACKAASFITILRVWQTFSCRLPLYETGLQRRWTHGLTLVAVVETDNF